MFNPRTNIETTVNSKRYFASEDQWNRGNVIFTIETEVSTYQDGSVVTKVRHLKNDSRECTNYGQKYFEYKNEKGFKAAINKVKKDKCVEVDAADLWQT